MRLATILIVALLLMGAFVKNQQAAPELAEKAIIEIVMLDEAMNKVGTALVPLSIRDDYSYIEFYDGETPPAGTDFDIVTVQMKEGGETYLLCIK